ncbi:PQQ-dependent sugar dehydrogenase [Arthrobacter sp. NPDC058288]|uniref:PQQ-dependent sugar dehydrogenase n=1 Tax=Arthrobacter sp. NPDC058288 TaxID=3346424 RepID=UPI0036E1E96A
MNRGLPGPASRPARRIALAVALACTLALAACTGGGSSPTSKAGSAMGTDEASREPRVLRKVEGLRLPWSAVFLPDGTAVISERDSGDVKAVKDGGTITLGSIPGVVPGGEGGLLGLAVSPNYASDESIFAYFTALEDNRIARLTLTEVEPGGTLTLGPPEIIFSGIPKASTHNGGRIRFGPDGNLYVGTGDSQRRDQPQDPNALGGKILRITAEGKPAPGNPFGDNPVYSLGHRNVQGLDWDDEGRLWSSEFGPTVDDELNLIQPGGNYGWPEVTGAPGRPGFVDAKVVWPSTAESSPSGLEIAGSTAYLGALRGQRLWAVPLDGENAGNPVSHFTARFGRIRDVSLAPDGSLWMLTNNQNPDFALILAPPTKAGS